MSKKLNILILISVVAIDQLSKFFANDLGMEIVLNTGISLSFLSSIPVHLLTALIMVSIVFTFSLFKKEWLENPSAMGFFFGGAVSNILDRVLYGGVKDWLQIPFLNINNNLADWFIFAGLILFMVFSIREEK